jgi:hypothetical protein
MLFLISRSLKRLRSTLLLLGLLTITVGILLVATALETTLIVAEGDLSQYWRTSYDILVRPVNSTSPIEEKYGLVEANHLSGLWGGISYEQYDLIAAIPGIEVAAPIAMIGSIPLFIETDSLGQIIDPGAYVVLDTVTVDDGAHVHEYRFNTYLYSSSKNPPEDLSGIGSQSEIFIDPDPPDISSFANISLLLAGIDPAQEARLAGLDQAIIAGEYLRGDDKLYPSSYDPLLPGLEAAPHTVISLPSLINITPYIKMGQRSELKRLLLPAEASTFTEIMVRGGTNYLATLPAETLGAQEMGSETLYRQFLVGLQQGAGGPNWLLESAPSPINYRETTFPFAYQGLNLEIVPPEHKELTFLGDPEYRICLDPRDKETWLNAAFNVKVKGVFNIDLIPKPEDINRVPMETYFPPTAILRYDEQGHQTEPRTLYPTRSTCGYIQPSPMILTTLEAARAIRGEDAISAIRVRVALDHCPPEQPETCTLTNADQRKIEAIAIEIQRQTGLDVDIMVGSSPTRVLVHVPEIGYVEEQWIQKGVNLVYKQGIQTGNWLLLGTLLLAGSLFTLDLTWAEVLSRRRLIALQKALGWRSSTVFTQIVGQVVMIGGIAAIAGIFIALALIRLLDWQSLPLGLLISPPLVVIGLCLIGSLVPAWSASRVPPIAELQRGGIHYRRKHTNTVSNLLMYAWSELKRRTVRSILTGLGSALSAGLLTLLLGVTVQQRGMLGGTLLGEFILVNIESYHYAIVGIGLGLAFLSTFNGLLGSILERQREIGVLKAVGWRTASVARLFILQGLLLGMAGASAGALAGVLVYFYLYRSASSTLALVILLGVSVPGLIGALAAIYPARLAAKVPPAEAVRYE